MACRGNVDLSLHLNLLIKKEPLHFSSAVQYCVLNRNTMQNLLDLFFLIMLVKLNQTKIQGKWHAILFI